MMKGCEIFAPTKKIKRHRHPLSSQDNVPAPEFKDGSLKKLVVTNFMVHQKLELVFGSHVNMITGVNGSGKSAILQAIVLALGIVLLLSNSQAENWSKPERTCQLLRS